MGWRRRCRTRLRRRRSPRRHRGIRHIRRRTAKRWMSQAVRRRRRLQRPARWATVVQGRCWVEVALIERPGQVLRRKQACWVRRSRLRGRCRAGWRCRVVGLVGEVRAEWRVRRCRWVVGGHMAGVAMGRRKRRRPQRGVGGFDHQARLKWAAGCCWIRGGHRARRLREVVGVVRAQVGRGR
jgi:hypothetical protein